MKNLNYAEEMNHFNRIWKADLREYAAAGMSETAIQAMYELHREQYNSDRRNRTHTQSLDGAEFDGGDDSGEDRLPPSGKFLERFSSKQPEISEWSRYDWIEDLDTPELARYIKSLPETSLEHLTRMVADGMSRADLARETGVSRAAVTKRLNPIKNFIANIMFMG